MEKVWHYAFLGIGIGGQHVGIGLPFSPKVEWRRLRQGACVIHIPTFGSHEFAHVSSAVPELPHGLLVVNAMFIFRMHELNDFQDTLFTFSAAIAVGACPIACACPIATRAVVVTVAVHGI